MEYQKAIKNFWDKEVENFCNDSHSEYLYSFLSKIKRRDHKIILDLGCGAGRNIAMMHDLGFMVYGCDQNKKMVLSARSKLPRRASKNIVIGNMVSLPYPDKFFDIVVSNGVFHNANGLEEFSLAIREAGRVLKKNGYLVLNTFTSSTLRDGFKKIPQKKFLYLTKDCLPLTLLTIQAVIKLLSENGLKLLSSEKNHVTVSTGKRKIFKGIFLKQ
jgi:ubiquinone/menaquinone biosynthesis C-methylase UbiE